MIAIGGTLLLTPGFVTDIFGADPPDPPDPGDRPAVPRFLPRPPILCRRCGRRIRRRRPGAPPQPPPPPGGRHYDFEGTAEEIDGEEPQIGR